MLIDRHNHLLRWQAKLASGRIEDAFVGLVGNHPIDLVGVVPGRPDPRWRRAEDQQRGSQLAPAANGLATLPHPLQGGAMQNKVVTTLERSLRELGLATVRFNFRGVGASTGTFDNGAGEADDLRHIAAWVRQVLPGDEIWLGGFSFGSYVAMRAAASIALVKDDSCCRF